MARRENMFKRALNANQRIVGSGPLGFAARTSGKAAGAFGRAAMTIPGGALLIGGTISLMSHDPTKNTFSSHMAQEGLKVGADTVFETALFGAASLLGPWGMGLAAVGSMAVHAGGLGPGEMVGDLLSNAGEAYKKERGLGPTPIKKNEQTMNAARQAMGLLGQSKGHNMLGHEASFMHN